MIDRARLGLRGVYRAYFRFYASLNDFLPPHQKQTTFVHFFKECASVKDRVEAVGVPHPEIDLILANGEPVDFSYLVQAGDRISVFPFFTSLELDQASRLRPVPLDPPRFVLDIHLGKLANYLRLLGFDCHYGNPCGDRGGSRNEHDFDDELLAQISSDETRILLTQDRGLLKRNVVTYGYCVRSPQPWEQLQEVLQRFNLFEKIEPFRRCLNCNGLLKAIDKAAVGDRIPVKTKDYYDEFRVCQACEQIYWKGSHYEKMQRFVQQVSQLRSPENFSLRM